MSNKVKYFYNPAYPKADWIALTGLNPTLAAGQIGVELDLTGKAVHMKVGPGKWDDLNYIENDVYEYTDAVTNAIGDILLGSDQSGRQVVDIVKDIISPYAPVTLEDATNNSGGAFANIVNKEVGQSVDTSVEVEYTINNPSNLKAGNNIFIEAGGVFENEGWFVHTGAPISLTLAASLIPDSNVTYTINIYAVDAITGNTEIVQTTIVFNPTILWGNDVLDNLSAPAIGLLPNRLVTDDYKKLFTFLGINFSHIYIPTMLLPVNLLFSEHTNPSNSGDYSLIPTNPATVVVNNGTGNYEYTGFVSEFDLSVPTKLKID